MYLNANKSTFYYFRYWEALQALVNGVLNKIQFQHNKAQLQHLDNDVRDDDVNTGYTSPSVYLTKCLQMDFNFMLCYRVTLSGTHS